MIEVVAVLANVMRREDFEMRSDLEMQVQALHHAKAQFWHIYADACACCKEIIYYCVMLRMSYEEKSSDSLWFLEQRSFCLKSRCQVQQKESSLIEQLKQCK